MIWVVREESYFPLEPSNHVCTFKQANWIKAKECPFALANWLEWALSSS